MNTKFADFNLITGYLDHKKTFEQHKKRLESIKKNLTKSSSEQFGITNHKTFQLMKNKIKSQFEQHKFNIKGNKKEKIKFQFKNYFIF